MFIIIDLTQRGSQTFKQVFVFNMPIKDTHEVCCCGRIAVVGIVVVAVSRNTISSSASSSSSSISS